jgi:hypothetical protein
MRLASTNVQILSYHIIKPTQKNTFYKTIYFQVRKELKFDSYLQRREYYCTGSEVVGQQLWRHWRHSKRSYSGKHSWTLYTYIFWLVLRKSWREEVKFWKLKWWRYVTEFSTTNFSRLLLPPPTTYFLLTSSPPPQLFSLLGAENVWNNLVFERGQNSTGLY